MAFDFAMPGVDLDEYRRQAAHEESMRQAQEIARQLQEAQASQQVDTAPQIQQGQQQPLPTPNNGLAATAAPQLMPMDTAARMFGQQIYNAKGVYDLAQQAGDAEGMKRASDFANALRDTWGKYGVDTSRFGADATRDQVGALLQADYAKGIEDVGNMKTSREYFYEAKQRYKDQGVSDRRAEDMALEDTRRYEGELSRKLAVAMSNYGIDDQGQMNRYAGLIGTMLYGNNPQSMAVYDSYYANPKEQWKFDKNLEAAGFMNGLKQADALQNFGFTRQLSQDQRDFQGREAQLNREHAMSMVNLQNAWKDMSEDKQRQFYTQYPELAAAVFGKRGGSGNGTGLSKAEMEVVQQLENAISQAAQAVDNGKSRAGDGEAVESARALMEDLYSKGKIDKDTYTVAYDRINQLISNRDKKWKRYNYADNIPEK